MKKFFSLLALVLFSVMGMVSYAEVISPEVAKATADQFLSLDSEWRGAQEAQVSLVEKDGTPAYYVVEYEGGGWAIVEAQSSVSPIIGYNTTDAYVVPEPMRVTLDACAQRIVDVARNEAGVAYNDEMQEKRRKPAKVDFPDVEPLIKLDLGQESPFNKYCPKMNGKPTLVGCVAVGMTQAMMVQRYPEAAQGKASYSCPDIGILSVNYDEEEPYDWEAMANGDYDEIARLLYHCGVSVNMTYTPEASGTGDQIVETSLARYFGYDPEKLHYEEKGSSVDEWLKLILTDITLGRVIIYFGSGDYGGHCWNLDGWKNSTQKVHVNWGWNGYGNGYFDIEKMEDSFQGMTFPYANSVVSGVGLPTTAPYGIKLSTTKFPVGTAAGVALADVIVSCEDADAVFEYELKGPKHPVTQKYTDSPYDVVDGKLVSTKTVEDKNSFKSLLMTVTNAATGEMFEKQFDIEIVSSDAVESVMSDAMRIYPAIATDVVTIEVPAVGGNYAIYSIAGAQLQAGNLDAYKNEVNVSSLAAGTYILQYVHQEGVGVKTFIKK